MMEQFWETIVATNFASGHAHNHVEGANWECWKSSTIMESVPFGLMTKKNQKITLKGA